MLTARRIALISLLVAAAALLGGTPSAGAAASDVVPSGFVRVELPNVDGQTPWFSTGLNQSNLAAPAANDLWLVGGFHHSHGTSAATFTPLLEPPC